MDERKCIAALIYPDFMSLDVVGPLQVFASPTSNVTARAWTMPTGC